MKRILFSSMAVLAFAGSVHAQQLTVLPPLASRPASDAKEQMAINSDIDRYNSNLGKCCEEPGQTSRTFNPADLKSKEVSQEVAMPKGGEVYIENTYRTTQIKIWDQPKVKVVTTVFYEGEDKLSNEEWLEKVNLSLRTLGTSVKIKSGGINTSGTVFYGSGTTIASSGSRNNTAIFNGNGQNIGTNNSVKRMLVIYIPSGTKVDIESKYADVQLPSGIGNVILDISNGNVEGESLNKLILRSKYTNVNLGDIKEAEVELSNGRFTAKNVGDLDIDTKYATVELAAAKKVVMRSTNDEYELEDVEDIRGRKNYGNMRITRLNGSFDLEGSNADIKIRNLGANVSSIKVNNKYADIRIPLRETKSYAINFSGAYSSVYGNFEKKPYTATDKDAKETKESSVTVNTTTTTVSGNVYRNNTPLTVIGRSTMDRNSDNPSMFTANVGDGKLKIDMKCQNCTVDFK
ncbi:DUF4097 domain-containing protein [Sediminibacterium ginsengisoli]|nr:DUF4097 domain-containing protein [Sediminibacterium ginsengisoli]